MKKSSLCALFLSFSMPFTVAVLSALGETRIDVYLSLFTLEYFVANALFSPRRKGPDLIGAVLLALFIYFVAVRVMEVLYGA